MFHKSLDGAVFIKKLLENFKKKNINNKRKREPCNFIFKGEFVYIKSFEHNGLVIKEKDPENGKIFIYSPTQKAKDQSSVLAEMIIWSSKYDKDTAIDSQKMKMIKNDRDGLVVFLNEVGQS